MVQDLFVESNDAAHEPTSDQQQQLSAALGLGAPAAGNDGAKEDGSNE